MVNERLKWNKKGLLLRTWIIGILIFTSIFALMFLASQELAVDYGNEAIIDESFRERYDKFDEIKGDYGSLFSEMSGEDPSVLEILGTLTVGVFRAFTDTVRITFASIGVFGDIIKDAGTEFGIPPEIASVIFPLILTILMVLFIFIIVSSINRGNKL